MLRLVLLVRFSGAITREQLEARALQVPSKREPLAQLVRMTSGDLPDDLKRSM